MKRPLLMLCAVLMLPLASVDARLIENWPYERLMEESDLVVVATAESFSEFDGTTEIPIFEGTIVPQIGTFHVGGVLKGGHEGETLDLVHCRLADDQFFPRNGPLLAKFETTGRLIRIETEGETGTLVQEGQPSYLLFLKRREDGRYEPVAGQVDSELSVRRVSSAFGF